MDTAHLIKQKKDEKILHVLHRHWFTFLPTFTTVLFLFAVPFGLYILISNLFPTILENQAAYAFLVLAGSTYFLGLLLLLFTKFNEFYLDVWIITDKRIVDVEQWTLFSRTISELDLFRIQDVTVDTIGFFPTVLKYGTVSIKTASDNIGIVFYDVGNANPIRQMLIELSEKDRRKEQGLGIDDI
tara:strand:- start:53 stop:607 length:555 start_codon:yes stop_codon:yes gene_type:complete